MRTLRLTLVALALVLVAGCSSASVDTASAAPLDTWTAALADRGTHSVHWVAIGDSISEGQGASSRTDRWIDLTREMLRKKYTTSPVGSGGGVGYLPAEFAVYGPDSTWADWATQSSGATALDIQTPDLGYRAVSMDSGATRSYPFTGTGLDIWWGRGGGTFTYAVDGGSTHTVDTAGSSSTAHFTKVEGLSSGDHSIVIHAISGVSLEGFTVYDGDRDQGITTFDSAHSGATVDMFLQNLPAFVQAVRAAEPDLITISLGGNDATTETPAELAPKYLKLVKALKKLPTHPSVLLLGEYKAGPSMADTFAAPWTKYLTVIRSVARETNSKYLSLYGPMPAATTSGSGLYSEDGLHPNDRGQKKIASLVYAALSHAKE